MGVTGQKTAPAVQAVGNVDVQFAHPRLMVENTMGGIMNLGGFKLQGEFMNISQFIPSSSLVPILGGGSVQLTNNNNAHRVTFMSIRTGGYDKTSGLKAIDENGNATESGGYYDIVAVADALKDLVGGDDCGGSFRISMGFNGTIYRVQMRRCTLENAPVMVLSGNDVPTYQVSFLCGKMWTESEEPEAIDVWDGIANGGTESSE
jgi:hypothetical protein